jgi:hypothetical protein
VFEDFELSDGAHVILGKGTTGNTFNGGAIVNLQPNSGGQYWIPLDWYDRDAAIWWSDPPGANKFKDVTFRLPWGRVQQGPSPLTFQGCRMNGVPIAE